MAKSKRGPPAGAPAGQRRRRRRRRPRRPRRRRRTAGQCHRCRHCRRRLGRWRRRCLCRSCYADPEIRKRYPYRCARCKRRLGRWQRRGLCWSCYDQPDVRAQFGRPSWHAEALRSGQDFIGPAAPAPGPLPGPPKSAAYMEELARRAAAQRELFPPTGGAAGANGSTNGAAALPLEQIARLFGVNGAQERSPGRER